MQNARRRLEEMALGFAERIGSSDDLDIAQTFSALWLIDKRVRPRDEKAKPRAGSPPGGVAFIPLRRLQPLMHNQPHQLVAATGQRRAAVPITTALSAKVWRSDLRGLDKNATPNF